MKKVFLILLFVLLATAVFSHDFVNTSEDYMYNHERDKGQQLANRWATGTSLVSSLSNGQFSDTTQFCGRITDKLRDEIVNNNKQSEIVSKITITTEYIYNNHKITKTVANNGTFVLQEPYIFGTPFIHYEITEKYDDGTFFTKYYGWNKKRWKEP
jgi:hypothetical protein